MYLNRFELYQQQLEHARWRVHFLLSLLQTHRQLGSKRDAQWATRESEYVRQLAAAQTALDRLDRFSIVRWKEQPSPTQSALPSDGTLLQPTG
jgi:hypothetical protein